MRFVIEHETHLSFSEPVREHHVELRLVPPENEYQRVESARIDVEPEADRSSYIDCYGNQVHHLSVVSPHSSLMTRLVAVVDTHLQNPFAYDSIAVEREREWIGETLRAQPRLWDYVLHHSPATPDLKRLALPGLAVPAYDPERALIDSVCTARDWISETLAYESGVTGVHSSLEEAIEAGAGVCQDFAHLLIAVVRSWDLPARYVMGYQWDDDQDEEGETHQAPHAWAEVLIPGAGWRGFDPTTGLVANDGYIAVAVGRDYLDAAPQRGTFKGEGEGTPPEVTLHLRQDQQ